ncbi:Hsp20/alpha crystallin family protein [uncultured Paludibaculum sp.]|uniref:Hsp20/alpha crystallin family protein n=1 Tax=uncultured Paludibaculum sp. TaxID=1765020 RepID=UPI002AABB889|nr:Hsp20/alpha crystallin family protein [uncultured Paludibaculum sp.]
MSNLTRRNPFAAFESFPNVGLSLFEDTLNRFLSESPASRPWSPAVDIAENENELILTADIPGVKMDEIDIKIEDGTLSLSGKREFEKKQEKGGYHRIERNYGSFQRVFTLPETVDVDKVSAQFDSGVLKVTLPKKEVAKPKSVKISVGNAN